VQFIQVNDVLSGLASVFVVVDYVVVSFLSQNSRPLYSGSGSHFFGVQTVYVETGPS